MSNRRPSRREALKASVGLLLGGMLPPTLPSVETVEIENRIPFRVPSPADLPFEVRLTLDGEGHRHYVWNTFSLPAKSLFDVLGTSFPGANYFPVDEWAFCTGWARMVCGDRFYYQLVYTTKAAPREICLVYLRSNRS